MVDKETIELFRIPPKTKVKLSSYDPMWTGSEEMQLIGKESVRKQALELLEKERGVLAEAQAKFYAHDVYAVLVVLQGVSGSGVEDIIRHVMTGVNPQGCQVKVFGKPSPEDLDHDFLWRYSKELPERGRIGIFLHSYYDEVVAAKVNPELLKRQKLPIFSNDGEKKALESDKSFWADRYKSINDFETHLVENGTVVLKFFLNISKEEQKKRLLKMIASPERNWRFSFSAMEERKFWEQYIRAYEEAISVTSTNKAPWYILPSNLQSMANALTADILTDRILELGVDFPTLSNEKMKELEEARVRLEKSE